METSNQAYSIDFREVGQDVVIWPLAKITNPTAISIGDSVIIDDFVLIMGGERTSIGNYCHIASFSSIVGGGVFIMEDFSGISGGVRVYTGNEDYLGGCLTNPTVPFPYRKPVRSQVMIKKHAIVGANTVILPGVTIEEGVAIGSNSLVNTDCKPWTIYAGSPVKPIKERKKDEILVLEELLRKQSYDKDGNYIAKNRRKN